MYNNDHMVALDISFSHICHHFGTTHHPFLASTRPTPLSWHQLDPPALSWHQLENYLHYNYIHQKLHHWTIIQLVNWTRITGVSEAKWQVVRPDPHVKHACLGHIGVRTARVIFWVINTRARGSLARVCVSSKR